MNLDDLAARSARNIERTYLAIGRRTPGARTVCGAGWVCCLSELDHPICNFGIVRADAEFDADGLRRLIAEKKAFNLYSFRSLPAVVLDRVRGMGFVPTYRLLQLFKSGPLEGLTAELEEAEGQERLRVAEFMVRQFFFRQSRVVRQNISQATAECELPLYWSKSQGQTVGAVMLCPETGVLGLYNLCIDPDMRSRGLGSATVRAILRVSSQYERPVVLQCDAVLESWYGGLGFSKLGTVEVFCRNPRETRL